MFIQRPASDWATLAALVAIFGGAFAGTKVALETIPPFAAVGLRLPLGAALIYALMRWQGHRLPPLFEQAGGRRRLSLAWRYLAGLGVIGLSTPFILMTIGLQKVDSALAGILTAIVPLATLVMAHYFSPGERIRPEGAAGFALGFAGLCLLMGPSALKGLGGEGVGHQGFVLAGALCYAASAVMVRRAPPMPFVTFTAGSLICASIIITPISLVIDPLGSFEPSRASAIALVALAIGPTALAAVLMFRLIQRAGAAFAAMTNYFVPLVALGIGASVMGEDVEGSAVAALVVILAGVAVSQVRILEAASAARAFYDKARGRAPTDIDRPAFKDDGRG